jgi:spore maturation protein CgeB
MRVFVFGSSITSTYWNGAATYYRGIYKNLSQLGYHIFFAEPDAYGRSQKRDFNSLGEIEVCSYKSPHDIPRLLQSAATADLVIKHSGVGVDDELLESEVLNCRSASTRVIFWDVDAPATLSRVQLNPNDPFRRLIGQYDLIVTYGGGSPVVQRYLAMGAKACHPVYNALDPETHFPVPPNPQLRCDLAFVGHRLPDRERRVEDFFFRAAELAPDLKFVLGGEGWGGKSLPANVRWIGHVPSTLHNTVNCSARMVLNINRDSMADTGYSPPTRVFEAAGAGACLITDAWIGIDQFFAPEREILIARDAGEIVDLLRRISPREAAAIGARMRQRALLEHTYQLRANHLDLILRQQHSVAEMAKIASSSGSSALAA